MVAFVNLILKKMGGGGGGDACRENIRTARCRIDTVVIVSTM